MFRKFADSAFQQVCLKEALAQSSCEPTDTICICMDEQLQANVGTCLLQACTLKQALCKQLFVTAVATSNHPSSNQECYGDSLPRPDTLFG